MGPLEHRPRPLEHRRVKRDQPQPGSAGGLPFPRLYRSSSSSMSSFPSSYKSSSSSSSSPSESIGRMEAALTEAASKHQAQQQVTLYTVMVRGNTSTEAASKHQAQKQISHKAGSAFISHGLGSNARTRSPSLMPPGITIHSSRSLTHTIGS